MTDADARIRRAVESDAPRVSEIARLAYAMYVARIGFEPPPMLQDFPSLITTQHLYVLESSGHSVCAYCAFWKTDDALHLSNVAVDPAYQGRGFGRLLISFVEKSAREQACAAVELYTNVHMTENQQLYPRLGYREVGRGEDEGISRVFYRKELT